MTLQRASYAAGILFAVLFAAGILVLDDTGQTPDAVVTYVKENENRLILSFILTSSAALLLQWFASGVSRRIRRDTADDLLPTVALVGGSVASACLLVMGALFNAPGQAFSEGKFEIDASAVQLMTTAGYGVWVGGFMALGVFVFASCLASRRAGDLPAWLTWSGLVIAVLQAVAFTFFPMILMAGWMLAFGIVLVMRTERVDTA